MKYIIETVNGLEIIESDNASGSIGLSPLFNGSQITDSSFIEKRTSYIKNGVAYDEEVENYTSIVSGIFIKDSVYEQRFLLAKAKENKIQKVKEIYNTLWQRPFLWGDGHIYQSDADARQNLSDALTVITATSPTIWFWYDINNVKVEFTSVNFKDMCASMWERGQGYYDVMQTKKVIIEAMTDVSTIEAYNLNTGWV